MAKGDLIYIESPYAESESGSVEDHVEYAKLCMKDCLLREEHPFASHLLFPQVLDDLNAKERKAGMMAGKAWGTYADIVAVYTDQGVTTGMGWGIRNAENLGITIEYRTLTENENDAA